MRTKICLILVGLLIGMSMAVPSFAQGEDPAQTALTEIEETESVEGDITVLKLPYGVSVVLEPDRRLPIEWWHTFSFDVNQDLNTKILRSFLGLSFGNTITDFSIGYSKEFNNPETEDWGTASLSFSWNF